MWGETYAKEDKGVTACVAFTQQGMDVLNNVNCELVEYPFARVAEGQIKTKIKISYGMVICYFFC